jgi:hypothetical protein
MPTLTKPGTEIYRDYVTDGVPESGVHPPAKADVRTYSTEMEAAVAALESPILTAARTYYVRADGNDANTGLANTAGGAFLTVQKAWDVIVGLDLAGFTVTVELQDGTYDPLNADIAARGGEVIFDGNPTSPGDVIVASTDPGTPAMAARNGARFRVQNIELESAQHGLYAFRAGSHIEIGAGMIFGACTGAHIAAHRAGAIITIDADYDITDAAGIHLYAPGGTIEDAGGATVTNAGTNAFSVFAQATHGGAIISVGATFSGGTITGQRYQANSNGIVDTDSGGITYFPGDSAGAVTTGGQYLQ